MSDFARHIALEACTGSGGCRYRSGFYWFDEEQKALLEASRGAYEKALKQKIATEARRTGMSFTGIHAPG